MEQSLDWRDPMRKIHKYVTVPALTVSGLAWTALIVSAPPPDPEVLAQREAARAEQAAQRAEREATAGVRYACSEFIKRSVHDPASFRPVDRLDWPAQVRDDGTATVKATYRATNAFGGMVQETVSCDITLTDGNYRLAAFRR